MTEHQLSRLLHEQTPEPPASIDLEELATRIREQAAPTLPRRRWLTPVTAAAATVAVVAAGAGVAVLTRDSGPAPTTTGLPDSTGSRLSTAGTPTTGSTLPGTTSGKTAEPALAWARQVVKRWEEQTEGQPFIPVGAWDFQRLGTVTAQERPYAAALDARRVVLAISLPPAPSTSGVVRWDDGSTRAADVQAAGQTFLQLLHSGTLCTNCPVTAEGGQTLRVTAAVLTTMRIQTTRGEATIPAWRFSFAGTRLQALQSAVDARAPAVVTTASEPVADSMVSANRAELAADGVTLTVHVRGLHNPAAKICGADYTGYAIETGRTAGILVTQRLNPTRVPCPAPMADRTVTITLTTPLEDRAVLDTAHGTPLPITRR